MPLNVESLTLAELREIAKLACCLNPTATAPSTASMPDAFPFKPGDIVMVMTVTMWFTGRVVTRDAAWLVIDDAAWIADSGRFNELFATGDAREVEPLPPGPFPIALSSVIGVKAFKTALRVVK